jgi:Ca2+-binding EF-hand superfamily protein
VHYKSHHQRRAAMATRLMLASLACIILMATITRAQKADVSKQQIKTSIAQETVKELLLQMDADKNGRISKQEWMKFMETQFDALDKDKTGELDQKELLKSTVTVKHPAPTFLGK